MLTNGITMLCRCYDGDMRILALASLICSGGACLFVALSFIEVFLSFVSRSPDIVYQHLGFVVGACGITLFICLGSAGLSLWFYNRHRYWQSLALSLIVLPIAFLGMVMTEIF